MKKVFLVGLIPSAPLTISKVQFHFTFKEKLVKNKMPKQSIIYHLKKWISTNLLKCQSYSMYLENFRDDCSNSNKPKHGRVFVNNAAKWKFVERSIYGSEASEKKWSLRTFPRELSVSKLAWELSEQKTNSFIFRKAYTIKKCW